MGTSVAAALLMAAAAVLGGCSPKTSITTLWSAPMPSSSLPMQRIVVMAVRMDEANRRVLEDSISGALAQHGVEGVPSYKLFPAGLPRHEQTAEAAVRSIDADGILSATFKGIEERLTYTPGAYPGGFWGSSYGAGTSVYGSAYVSTDSIVNLETTLWDARAGDNVVWAAMTKTTNPSSGRDFVNRVTDKIVPALAAGRFIPPGPPKK